MCRAAWIVLLLGCLTGCAHSRIADRPPATTPDGDFPIIKSIINHSVAHDSPNL
jgi:hypothetical protein